MLGYVLCFAVMMFETYCVFFRQIYSLVSSAIGADQAALEAEVTAAELSQNLPLRSISSVLW